MIDPSFTRQRMFAQVQTAINKQRDKFELWQILKQCIRILESKFYYKGRCSQTIVALLFMLLLLTYLLTSLRSNFALRTKISRKPPIAPYFIPFLGNLLPFILNPAEFCAKTTQQYGYSTPVRVRLGPFKMFLVSGADQYIGLFNNKASRSLNTKGAVLLALKNLFGTPANVIPFYAADDSGVNSTPLPGSRVKAEHRITYFQTRAAHKYLSGPALVQMTDCFLGVLRRRMDESQIGLEWTEYPDIYAFLQDNVFRAAVEALCGSHLLSQSPTFVEDFWEFTSSVPALITGFPLWMWPKPYRTRRRLLDAVKKWHKVAHEQADCTRIGVNDPEWEPYFGSKLMRARQEYSAGMEPMNAEALAAEDLGLIFATNTNSIPSLTWFIFEICRDSGLQTRVEEEISACRIYSPETNKRSLDIQKLCGQPLLQSIYAETLRLRVALFVTRTPEREDFCLGEWRFPPKVDIVLSSRTAAMNPNVWNAGTSENLRPLDTFWADRFLIYPNDPKSGPLRKEYATEDEVLRDGKHPVGIENSSGNSPVFSMDGVGGGWIPYGGGQRMCPGRHFAKQEIIGTLALLLTDFEIQLNLRNKTMPESDMRFFPFGGLPPTAKIPFKIRRRAVA